MRRIIATCLIGSLVFAACGGDGGDDPAVLPAPGPTGDDDGARDDEPLDDEDRSDGEADDTDEDHDAPAGPVGDVAHIRLAAVGSPDAETLPALAASFNAFGFDLHRSLAADGDGNVVTSPLSVATLLALVTAGADGATADELTTLLGLSDPRDARVGALLLAAADTTEVSLAVANALWSNLGVPLDADYVAHVNDVLGATVDEVDLGDAAAVELIDAWVRGRTADRIEGIAEDLGLPDPEMALVLVNAVHFLGEWSVRFDAEVTRDAGFTLPDGTVVEVPMMRRQREPDELLGYAQRDGYQLLRLPYGDDARYGLEVLLPDVDSDLDRLLARLDSDEWQAAVAAAGSFGPSEIGLPRLELAWDGELSDELRALGIPTVLGPGADLTRLTPVATALSVVVHRTFLRVDEEGTEAAAVTGGAMPTSAPLEPFIVDRPFVLTLSDAATGTVLFIASVTDPR